MGHFGTSSSANDTSWDVLGKFADKNGGYPSTQPQANALAVWILAGFPGKDAKYWRLVDESDTILGPVIYVLKEGLVLPVALLERALAIALARRKDNGYLECWTDRKEREGALTREAKLIRKAIKDAK